MIKKMVIICFVLAIPLSAFSQENEEPVPIAFIFNLSNLLEPPESYQGGVGLKYLHNKANIRFLIDIYHSQESETSSIKLGAAVEKHINDNFISPYFGFTLYSAYILLNDSIDSDNWTRETVIPIEGGPIFGVEVFFTEYLSLFAEYSATLEYRMSTLETSNAGNKIVQKESFFTFDTGIGNSAKLGLTIYLDDQVTMPER